MQPDIQDQPSSTPPLSPTPETSPRKKGLLLPILLMTGPSLLIIATILLYAIVAFVASSQAPASTNGELFSHPSPIHSAINVLLFAVGAISVMGLLPCFIIGLVLLIQRLNKKV